MAEQVSAGTIKKSRAAGPAGIALCLCIALVLWAGIGWGIDYYIASTAEQRFAFAVLHGDRTNACINAVVAAQAYEVARDRAAIAKWHGLEADFCR